MGTPSTVNGRQWPVGRVGKADGGLISPTRGDRQEQQIHRRGERNHNVHSGLRGAGLTAAETR